MYNFARNNTWGLAWMHYLVVFAYTACYCNRGTWENLSKITQKTFRSVSRFCFPFPYPPQLTAMTGSLSARSVRTHTKASLSYPYYACPTLSDEGSISSVSPQLTGLVRQQIPACAAGGSLPKCSLQIMPDDHLPWLFLKQRRRSFPSSIPEGNVAPMPFVHLFLSCSKMQTSAALLCIEHSVYVILRLCLALHHTTR